MVANSLTCNNGMASRALEMRLRRAQKYGSSVMDGRLKKLMQIKLCVDLGQFRIPT